MLQELAGGDKSLRYLCENETRLGLQTIPGRRITFKGVKPIGMAQWMRDNFYLYGVIEPLTGERREERVSSMSFRTLIALVINTF